MTEPQRGRPRNDKARAAALHVARDLLQEHGYEGLSLDMVAEQAGVSKQSLYRWWGSKSELIAQTVLAGYAASAPLLVPNSDDVRADLGAIVESLVQSMSRADNAPLIRAMVVVAATDSDAAAVLWDRFTGPARLAIAERLNVGISNGQLRPGFSSSVAAEAIIGAGLFLILGRQDIPAGYADSLLELLFSGIDGDTSGR